MAVSLFSDFTIALQTGLLVGGSFVFVQAYIAWANYGVKSEAYFE